MTAEETVIALAALIEQRPDVRIGHMSMSANIVALAHALTYCPKCGREFKDSPYCLKCGHIKGKASGY